MLRRHAQLLSDAGIDVLIFDTTNGYSYWKYPVLLRGVSAGQGNLGGRSQPQIAFMVNTLAGKTAQQIYDDLYKPGALPGPGGFNWLGKPLMICDPTGGQPWSCSNTSRCARRTGRSR